MSILRESGRQQRLCCDTCGHEGDEFDQARFGQMIEAAKEDGWLIERGMSGFVHACPDCTKPRSTALEDARRKFSNHASRLLYK